MDWLSDNAWAAWLTLAIVLEVLELASMDLILLMLGLGAGSAALTAVFTDSFPIQAGVATAVSLGCLLLIRPPLIKRLHNGPDLVTGIDRLIGMRSITTTDVSALNPGRIKIDGEDWKAVPFDDQMVIPEGQPVEVLQIRGATALVHPIPANQE